MTKTFLSAVVAEWSKVLTQTLVERMPGSNPAWGLYLFGTIMDPLHIYVLSDCDMTLVEVSEKWTM